MGGADLEGEERPPTGMISFVAFLKDDVPGDRFAPIRELAVARVDASSWQLERLYSATLRPTPAVFTTARDSDGSILTAGPAPRSAEEAIREFLGLVEGALVAVWGAAKGLDDLECLLFDVDMKWRQGTPRLLDVPGLSWATFGQLPTAPAELALWLGVEPPAATALSHAWWMARAVGRLREAQELGGRIARMQGDEAKIADRVIRRLEAGHRAYGPWRVDDGRDYPRETFEELIDGLHYLSAEVERLERKSKDSRTSRPVILCLHPDPRRLHHVAGRVLAEGSAPILAQPVLAQYLKHGVPKGLALRLLVDGCDEVRVFGRDVPMELRELVAYARAQGRPVRYAAEAAS